MKIFIIIPCWNDAASLEAVIKSVKPYGQVVVVDDGSGDQSYQLAKTAGVFALRHFFNRGQGAALETGNAFALKQGADIVVHFDADGQHLSSDIPKLLEPILKNEADVVLGSRFLNEFESTPFFKKWFILKPAIWLQYFLYGLKLTDAHNGLRAISRKALEKMRITQDRYAHASEIVELIARNRFKVKEVPVEVIYRRAGQGFGGGLRILKELFIRKLNK